VSPRPPSRRSRLRRIHAQLFEAYGPQGWWPLLGRAGERGFDERGYHPGRRPHLRPVDRFEIAVGAVLTQNTAWTNVEKALDRLLEAGVRLPADVLRLRVDRLSSLVRSSGAHTQKARKLLGLAGFFGRPGALDSRRAPSRDALLSLWGIGPETADSILLYAFDVPLFVADACARRLLGRTGLARGGESYGEVQGMVHDALPGDAAVLAEAHALIVAHAKASCRARPACAGCPVRPCARRGVAGDEGPGP
jgi:endonuclease-3 related protein